MTSASRSLARASRGSAAIEMLLSLPILMVFPLLVFGLTRAQHVQARVLVAARHAAWHDARRAGAPGDLASLDAATLGALHFADRGGTIDELTATTRTVIPGGNFQVPLPSAEVDPDGPLGALLVAFSRHGDYLGHRFELRTATVGRRVEGVPSLLDASFPRGRHFVALRAGEEEGLAPRRGWSDLAAYFWRRVAEGVEGLLDHVEEAFP
jgi:hypothetical protein